VRVIDGHAFLGRSFYMEQSTEALIAEMDRLGVDVSVVVAPPPGPFYDDANGYVMRSVAEHPGRLAALFRANPHLDGQVEKFREALGQGCVGLQLDPTNDGYGVGNPRMDPLVEAAGEEGVPVYIHSGDSIFCPPEAVADYAARFKDVNFVTTMSRGAPRAARGCDNLYVMSRPFPTLAFQRGYDEGFDLDRVIFVSDAPLSSLEVEMRAVELAGLEGDLREKILGGNLGRIMRV
jgi:predicted TIM-barrel fold metal-dependent hydrolase